MAVMAAEHGSGGGHDGGYNTGNNAGGQLNFQTMETSLVLACAVFAGTALCALCARALPCTPPRARRGLVVASLAMAWYSMSVGFTLFNKFVLR